MFSAEFALRMVKVKCQKKNLTLVLLNPKIYYAFANSVDQDQLASEEANLSGSALFVVQNMILYQQPGSSNMIG